MEKGDVTEGTKDFQKVRISGVYMANSGEGVTPIVFLDNEKERILPIYIGGAEAFSIQTALEKLPYPRPLTHDLLVSILEGFQSKIEKVLIDDLNDGVFFARIIVRKNGDEYEFDARPSDSLALAIRTEAPVYVSNRVMESASVDKGTYKLGQ
ncbi:MAG: bifunctional nuclease family protein [Candidatus Hydrothermarchaeota archaeon]